MKITIEPGDTTEVDGIPCRLWYGLTDSGKKCFVLVHRIAVHVDEDQAEFERELEKKLPPKSPLFRVH